MKNRIFGLFICLAVIMGPMLIPASAQQQVLGSQKILELAKPAIVFVEYFYKGFVFYQGQKYGSAKNPSEPFFESFFGTVTAGPFAEGRGASGFLVHPDGYILTAGHCVQDYTEQGTMAILSAFIRDYKVPAFVQQTGRAPTTDELKNLITQVIREGATVDGLTKEIYIRTGNWSAYKADVLIVSEYRTGKDVAILKIPGKNFPTVPIGNSDTVKEGDSVMVFGFPGIVQDITQERSLNMVSLLIPTVTSGIISAIKTDVSGSTVFQLDAATAGGNSGGPAVNARGETIGICSFGSGATNYTGDSYGMFVPINVAKIFVNQAGFVPQSGLTDQVYQKALQFYWEGDYKNALKEFKTVIEFYPRHPVAERYILECTENVTKGLGKSAGFPSWLKWILIIIAAVAVIAVIVVLLSKRSSGGPAKPKKGLGYLYGQAGTLAGNKFMVEKTGLRLGRDPARCQIVIQEDVISREHAVIEPTPDGKAVRVRNLSATNPTYVNERAVTEVELKEGDQVRIGKTVFVYKIE